MTTETNTLSSTSPLVRMRMRLGSLGRDRKGAAFVEYLIIVGIVALLGIAIFRTFRGHINTAAQGQGGAIDQLGQVN